MVREEHIQTPLDLQVRVRYCECDPMGVAHHSAYIVWMEMARCDLLEKHGKRYRDLEEEGTFFVVARLNIRYRKPAKYDDSLIVRVKTVALGGAKVDHEYEVRRGDELLATAETTIVCVDDKGRVKAIPEGSVQ